MALVTILTLFADNQGRKGRTMQAPAQATQKAVEVISLSRDQVKTVFTKPGDMRAFSAHYKAAMKEVKGLPLGKDPAAAIKRTRNSRGRV